MEEKKFIDENDTTIIHSAYKFLQTLNVVTYSIFMLAAFILTIVIANYDEVLWLIPVGAALIFTLVFLIIKNLLIVQFGLYYDVRVLRLNSQQIEVAAKPVEDTLPEL